MVSSVTATWNLGFLTILREGGSFLGGYLVTNQWGRPLEFRLSSAVQPNRVQQILYGPTLYPYICGDLIGNTLIDKTVTRVQVIVTDTEAVLELRQRLEIPILFLKPQESTDKQEEFLSCHQQYPSDGQVVHALRQRIGGGFDLNEPFQRIREAIAEAHKMGVTNRG